MTWKRRISTAAALGGAAILLGAGLAGAQDLARGETLFELCQVCHGDGGVGNASIQAPAIAGLPAYYVQSQLEKFQQGIRGGHPDDYPGLRMRPMSRTLKTTEDTQAVAAYVASLPVVSPAQTLSGGDAEQGAQLYTTCIACHGAKGDGNPALNGPPLRHLDDWYLLSQVQNFKTGIRGASPGDTTGALMRPMAMILADDQAIHDVIAHILTLTE